MHQSIKEPAAPQRDPSASRNGFEMIPPPPRPYAPHPRQTDDRSSANCRTEVRVATPPVTFYVVERLSSRQHATAQAPEPEPQRTPAAVITQ
jgi:hypothetical protein